MLEILNSEFGTRSVSPTNPLPIKIVGSTMVFGSVNPTNYLYIGKNGNDTTGDGSAGNPYLTISAANTAATAGTTLFAFPGIYAENITFKAGVNITCPVEYGVYITGNHVAAFSGTVICENIVLQNASSAASGTVLTVSGVNAVNLQFLNSYINSMSASGAADAINWTNTNAASKLQVIDGNINVLNSGATARAFYSTTGAAGSINLNRCTVKLNNPNNVALGIGGAVSIVHTSDQVIGQVVCAKYLSSGVGGAATLNGGAGASPLTMAPIRIRTAALLPAAAVAAGILDGTIEHASDGFYVTTGTTRSKITGLT